MTWLRRSTKILFLILAAVLLASPSWAQSHPRVAEQMAKTFGLASYDQIEALRYTFNAELPGVNLSRSWVWEPKTGKVSYSMKDKDGKLVEVTYSQAQLDREPAKVRDEIDPAFFNDEYNLLFPFHVIWDGSADVQDLGKAKLPIGKGPARHLVIKYPSDGGYTPGDTWELFLGPNHRVKAFVYHRGGPMPPNLVISTWERYKKAGPLLVAMERRGTADGRPLHVFFTDVAVRLAGSNTWLKAK